MSTKSADARDAAVVICCYTADRYDDVLAAIASVRAQDPAPARLLVIVDHNPELLAQLQEADPELDVRPSSRTRGLSGARNTALDIVTEPVIVFLDDDAAAEPGWLEALTAPFARPLVAGTGGRLDPAWDEGRPSWFPPEFDWVVGCSHPGQPAAGGEIRNPIGANMAFRTDLLREAGGFEEDMGRVGTTPLGCEETEASIRIATRNPGVHFWYTPTAVARHRVRAERGEWGYFRSRCYGEGLSKAVVRNRGGQALGTESSYVSQVLAPAFGRALLGGLRGDGDAFRRALPLVAGLLFTTIGYAVGSARGKLPALPRRTRRPRRGVSKGAPKRRPADASGVARIGVFTARARPEIGGIESHVAEVTSRLVRDGFTLDVLATDRSGGLPRWEVIDAVPVERVPAYPRTKDWYLSPALFRRAFFGRYDLIHVQGIHTLVPPLVMLAAWLRRTPYVVTFHTGGTSSATREKIRGPQFKVLAPLLRRAAALIAVSEFEARRFEDVLGWQHGRIQVIRNGGSLPVSATAPADPVEIATVGRLEHYKGHHRAIEALPHLLETHPGTRLRILGSGPYRDDLVALAGQLGVADNVSIEFVPPDDRQLMADTISKTSVVGLLSDYEAHPVAVMEALTLGRPVVVSRTSGLTEIAEMGWAVGLSATATPEETAAAFRNQIEVPILPEAQLLPTWETCVSELAAVLEGILAARGKTARAKAER